MAERFAADGAAAIYVADLDGDGAAQVVDRSGDRTDAVAIGVTIDVDDGGGDPCLDRTSRS